jgi:poly(hydroxyalkanoate) depolymerase family esterase
MGFLSRIRESLSRLLRRKPPEPGRFEHGSKFALTGWISIAPWVWPSRDYLVYVPRGYTPWKRRPLLVLLHGCRQTPEEIAAATRITALADAQGWLVLLPRQKHTANGWRCWNWFDKRTAAGRGEAAIVAAQVRVVRRAYRAHPRRVFVVGMSAGGCLAAVLGLRLARMFAAVGVHSGVACGAASSPLKALQILASGADAPIEEIARLARDRTSLRALPLPLCVIHGGRDSVVAAVNATELVRQYLVFNAWMNAGASPAHELPAANASTSAALDGGRTIATDDYRIDRRLIARLIRVPELGHAWSGGDAAYAYNDPLPPDATKLFAEFFVTSERDRVAHRRILPWPSRA